MSEFNDICQNLRDKEQLSSVGRLIDLKTESLEAQLWTEKDKEKVWEIRNSIILLKGFKKEISVKSQKTDEDDTN